MQEEIIKMFFALAGVGALVILVVIDRRLPGDNPIDRAVYRLIGGYILFVFAGPKGVRTLIEKVSEVIVSKFLPKK